MTVLTLPTDNKLLCSGPFLLMILCHSITVDQKQKKKNNKATLSFLRLSCGFLYYRRVIVFFSMLYVSDFLFCICDHLLFFAVGLGII
jgi:hypothetical protein